VSVAWEAVARRSVNNPRVAVVEEYMMTPPHGRPSVGDWVIDVSWDVYAADGEKIGTIDEVHPHFLVVRKGFIFHRERYVPVSAITTVERECVYLNVSSTDIDDLGWNQLPDIAGDVPGMYEPQGGAQPESAAAG